ncbi:MAG: hypothetical protein V7739_01970 [Motiliproteus sp.]
MSSYEDDAFPIEAAWSLSSGEIKSSLISPDEDWLDQLYEQGDILETDPDILIHEGHSPKSIMEELQLDLEDNPLYCVDPDMAEQALTRVCESMDREYDLKLRPAAELMATIPATEREQCRQDCISMLDLNEHQSADQVRLWLEMFIRLTSDREGSKAGTRV